MAWVHDDPMEILHYYREQCDELSDTKAKLNYTRLQLVRAKKEVDAEEREATKWGEKKNKWTATVEESRQWGRAWSQKQESAMKKAEAARLAAPLEYRKYCLVCSGGAAGAAGDATFTVRAAPNDAAPPIMMRGSPVVLHDGSMVWGCEPEAASDMPDVAEGKWLKVDLDADDGRFSTNKKSSDKLKREAVGFVLKAPNLECESCFKPYAEAAAEARGREYKSGDQMPAVGDLVQISSGVATREIKPNQGRLLVVSPWPSRFNVGPAPAPAAAAAAAAADGGPPSEQEAAAAKQEKRRKALAAHQKKEEDEESRRASHVWCFQEPPIPLPALPPKPGNAAGKTFEKLQRQRAALKEELRDLKDLVSQLRGAVLAQGDGMERNKEHWEMKVIGEQLHAFTAERTGLQASGEILF